MVLVFVEGLISLWNEFAAQLDHRYMINVVYVVLSSNLCCKGNHLYDIVHDQYGIMEQSS